MQADLERLEAAREARRRERERADTLRLEVQQQRARAAMLERQGEVQRLQGKGFNAHRRWAKEEKWRSGRKELERE